MSRCPWEEEAVSPEGNEEISAKRQVQMPSTQQWLNSDIALLEGKLALGTEQPDFRNHLCVFSLLLFKFIFHYFMLKNPGFKQLKDRITDRNV